MSIPNKSVEDGERCLSRILRTLLFVLSWSCFILHIPFEMAGTTSLYLSHSSFNSGQATLSSPLLFLHLHSVCSFLPFSLPSHTCCHTLPTQYHYIWYKQHACDIRVPHDNILGPSRLHHYINDLCSACKMFSYVQYADDTVIFLNKTRNSSLIYTVHTYIYLFLTLWQ